jgi:pilus assembly protein CpaB
MRRRLLTVLLFAIAGALAASTLVYRVMVARASAPRPTGPMIAVAGRDLAVGALVQDSDVSLTEWKGAVDPQWAIRREDVVGRGLTANVNRGEPFPGNRLAPRGAGAGLAAIIPPGMRAVAVKVDEVVGVSGFVLPGMRVDILSSGVPPGQNSNNTITRTILQNIEVLSAGQNLERDAQGKPASVQVVNLLVTPQDAEKLSLASGQMKVQLVLRNPLDTGTAVMAGVSSSHLLLDGTGSDAPPRPVSTAQPAPHRAPKPAPAAAPPRPAAPPLERVSVPVTVEVIQSGKRDAVVVGHVIRERPAQEVNK